MSPPAHKATLLALALLAPSCFASPTPQLDPAQKAVDPAAEKACTDSDPSNWCNAQTPIYADAAVFQSQILNSTNYWRGVHQAPPMSWDDSLAAFAEENGVRDCINQHTFARGIPNTNGENLAWNFDGPTSIVDAWVGESAQFDYANPVVNSAGHFQTIVWVGSTKIGCARAWCGDVRPGTGWLVYCETNPRPLSYDAEVTRANVKPPV